MKWLSGLLSLIRRFLELFKKKQEPKPESEQYTREQFIEAVKELSNNPVWRARILKDALNKLKKMRTFETRWIDRDLIVDQTLHRGFGCGIIFSFGEGINAINKEDWDWLISVLQQNMIKYVSELTDCDNFATFFKGFTDYVVGKDVVIYTTGLVFRVAEQLGQKVCLCRSEYLIGGHAWNRIVMNIPIEIEKIGSTERVVYEFTVYNYEPQSDEIGDKMIGDWCYMSGGYLPVIFGRR